MTISVLANRLAGDIWEVLLISANGLNNNIGFLNSPVWTVSAMLIAEFFILCLLTYAEDFFFDVVCPLSILVISGYYRHLESGNWAVWRGFTTFGVIRVYFIMCCAYYCYRLSIRLKQMKFNSAGTLLLSVVEALCFLMIFLIIMIGGNLYFTWCAMLLMVIACAITISGQSYSIKVFKNSKVTRYLGRFSFSIYLVHVPIVQLYRFYFVDSYAVYAQKVPFVIMTAFAGIVFLYFADFLIQACNKLRFYIQELIFRKD